MNRLAKLNNCVSTKEIEFKINELYKPMYQNIIINPKTCRYCLEQDDKEYISPCLCKGGSKYIHEDCLNQWREVNISNPEKRNTCEICKYKYKFKRGEIEHFYKFLITINCFSIEHIIIFWFVTMSMGCADILANFFIIRTLNFYNYDNSNLLILFKNYNENEKVFFITYFLFYFSLSSFLFDLYYAIKFYFKCYKLFTNEHYKSLKRYMHRYYIQIFLFLYYYYFCLILNVSLFYVYSSIFISVTNNIYRLQFYKKHNKTLETLIRNIESTGEILSFEENPLLGHLDGAEKKDPIGEIAIFDEKLNNDSSNENDASIIDVFNNIS